MLVSPAPSQHVHDPRAKFSGHINREGMVTPVEVRYLSDESGHDGRALCVRVVEGGAPNARGEGRVHGGVGHGPRMAHGGCGRHLRPLQRSSVMAEFLPAEE